MGKGQFGVTFPFLVGAVSRVNGEDATSEYVEKVFDKIISEPVPDYYCEVRWCGNVDEPVASIKKLKEIHTVSIDAQFEDGKTKEVSLAFTTDLMSMFTLNCSTRVECLEKLKTRTTERIEKGEFSKNGGVFTAFTDDDIEFIEHIKDLSKETS